MSFMLFTAAVGQLALDAIAPDEFRRKIEFYHLCVTEVIPESGYRELGKLRVDRGDNSANIALTSNGPSHHFEKGTVERVDAERGEGRLVLYATIRGERHGEPAELLIKDEHDNKAGTRRVTATLKQASLTRQYQCDPDIRPLES